MLNFNGGFAMKTKLSILVSTVFVLQFVLSAILFSQAERIRDDEIMVFEISPLDADIIFTAETRFKNKMFRTLNGGKSWGQLDGKYDHKVLGAVTISRKLPGMYKIVFSPQVEGTVFCIPGG